MKPRTGDIMNQLKYWICFLAIIFTTHSFANIIAKVDRTEVFIGETLNLVIKTTENSSAQPDLSVISDEFRVISNSSSTSTQIINGQRSFEKSWNIILMPLKEGQLSIPVISVGNQSTQAIQIKVGKPDPNAKSNGDLFIEITTDKISAFVKEQIIFKVKLFYSISLSEGSLSEPYASDTLVTMLDKNSTFSTVRDGKRYEVIERHYAMFAEKSGTMEINPIIFNGRDNSSRRSMSMFSTGKPVRAVSKPISIEIKPIPQNAIGKDWLPAKSIRLSEQWSNRPFTVGEPITRTITLFAEGLSETQIPNLDLGEIDKIKVYPEQPQTQTEITPKTIKAIKQIKMALIPTQDGSVRIPEYNLQWFNTETGKIEQAKLPPRSLNVEPGSFAPPPVNIQQQLDNMLPKVVDNKSVTTSTDISSLQNLSNSTLDSTPEGSYWKYSTAGLLLLWLATLGYFIYQRKAGLKPVESKSKPVIINKKDVLAAINAKNLKLIQTNFIDWWNQQYPQNKVVNLSQLVGLINPPHNSYFKQIESNLYTHEKSSFDYQGFKKSLESNQFKPIDLKLSIDKGLGSLPELYT